MPEYVYSLPEDDLFTPAIKDYQHALTMCLIERKVLYKDHLRNQRTQGQLDRKFWEFWK